MVWLVARTYCRKYDQLCSTVQYQKMIEDTSHDEQIAYCYHSSLISKSPSTGRMVFSVPVTAVVTATFQATIFQAHDLTSVRPTTAVLCRNEVSSACTFPTSLTFSATLSRSLKGDRLSSIADIGWEWKLWIMLFPNF